MPKISKTSSSPPIVDQKELALRSPLSNPLKHLLSAKEIETATGARGVFRRKVDDGRTVDHTPISKRRVLHMCVEYKEAGFTGVNEVATTLPLAQRKNGLDARVIIPFYDFLKTHPNYQDAEFKGFIEHMYNGKTVKSSLYKVWTENKTLPVYLVVPDPSYRSLFDVGDKKHIYDNFSHSKELERELYFASVTAAAANCYQGNKVQKAFDLFHIHTWQSGFAANLIQETYNPARGKENLAPIHPVLHFHNSAFTFQGVHNASNFRKIGVEVPKKIKKVNTQASTWLAVDGIIHVSKHFAKLAQDPKTPMYDISRQLAKEERLAGVTNGNHNARWDISNEAAYSDFSLKDDQILEAKSTVKKAMYEAGLIPHPDKPLFLFVGRLVEDKGTEVLPAMAKEIIKEGGQIVIMGSRPWGNYLPPEIKYLRDFAKGHPDSIRIYTERPFQDEKFADSNVSKGLLLRMAADFSLIPSKIESCGLVFPEALLARSIPITSGAGGLSDSTKPYGQQEDFNCFTFDGTRNQKKNASSAIRKAFKYHRETSSEEKNQTLKRFSEEIKKYDWNAPDGPVDKINRLYENALKAPSQQYHEEKEVLKKRHVKLYRGASNIRLWFKNVIYKISLFANWQLRNIQYFMARASLKLKLFRKLSIH